MKITYSHKMYTVGAGQVRAELVVFIVQYHVMMHFLIGAFRQACEAGIIAISWIRKLRARIPQLLCGQVEPESFWYQFRDSLGFSAAALKGCL